MTDPAPPLRLPRDRLVAAILRDPARYVVIQGAAGTGKSWLLDDLRRAGVDRPLVDLPPGAIAPLPPGPCIIAQRPETDIAGLARADIYGQVSRYADLLFTAADMAAHPGLHDRTGGWACLIPAALSGRAGSGVMAAFLRAELLTPLPSTALVALDIWLTDPDRPPPVAAMPFATGPGLPAPLAAVRAPLTRALRAILADRATDRTEARAIAMARVQAGQLPQGIAMLQAIGAWDAALSALKDAGGLFTIYRHGPDAYDRMLAGFPADLLASDNTLVLCRAIQAIKRGEVPLMHRILIDRWGPDMADAATVIDARDRYPLDLRFERLMIRTWEDFDFDPQFIDSAWALLAEIPAEDDLLRGSFYNAVLEFYNRSRRYAEADHVAGRAARHYARAQVPILSFYIDLHRAIISLCLGQVRAAQRHAAAARAHLAATPFDSPGDARLLALAESCIRYESGESAPLMQFLALEIDAFATGEIWPTIVELTLTYGAQVLTEHRSLMAARAFLDRWRVTQAQSRQFRQQIDIREVAIIQSAGRWAEAAMRAATLPGRVTAEFVLTAGQSLTVLTDRDEVAMALVWLRQTAQVDPAAPGLSGALVALLQNPFLNARQRVGAEIWLAHVLQRQRRFADALAQLRQTLTVAAEEGALAALGEEAVFLTPLLANRRLRADLDRSENLRRLLRQLAESGPGRSAAATAAGLTRQESRILHAIGEGATNKAVANLLGLSERTVKFHLANLFGKLAVHNRIAAVQAARALGLVN